MQAKITQAGRDNDLAFLVQVEDVMEDFRVSVKPRLKPLKGKGLYRPLVRWLLVVLDFGAISPERKLRLKAFEVSVKVLLDPQEDKRIIALPGKCPSAGCHTE